MVPLPVAFVAPPVIVTQEGLSIVVRAQAAGSVTAMLPLPPVPATLALDAPSTAIGQVAGSKSSAEELKPGAPPALTILPSPSTAAAVPMLSSENWPTTCHAPVAA